MGGALGMHLANQMVNLTLGWFLYEQTHSWKPLFMIGLAKFLPKLIFALPAGLWADHINRKLLMRLTLAGMFLFQAGLAVAAWQMAPLWVWYLLTFGWGVSLAIHTPVAVSFYPNLLPQKDVANSVIWASSNYHINAMVGPVLAGLVIHALGPVQALGIASLCPLLYIALLSGVEPLRHSKPKDRAEPLRARILGGWHHLRKEGILLWALGLDLCAVLIGGAEAILPMYAKDILHVGPVGLGFLVGASFGGNLLMGMWLAHHPLQRAGRAFLWAVGGFGASMVVFSLSQNFYLSFLALLVAGSLDGVSIVVRQTLVQLRTPEHLRGRVQAVNFLFVGTSNELGEVESAAAAGLLGPVYAVLLGGIGTIVLVVTVAKLAPELRELGKLAPKRA